MDHDDEDGSKPTPWETGPAWERDSEGKFVDQSAQAELRRLKDVMWGPLGLSEDERSFAERVQRRALGFRCSARAISALHIAEEHIRKAHDTLTDGFCGPQPEPSDESEHWRRKGFDPDAFEDEKQKEAFYHHLNETLSSLGGAFREISFALREATADIRYAIDGFKSAEKIGEAAQEAIFLRMCAERGFDNKRRTDFLMASFGWAAARKAFSYEERAAWRDKYRKAVAEDEARWKKYKDSLGDYERDEQEMMPSERGDFPTWFVAFVRGDLLAYQRQMGLAPRRAATADLDPITPEEAKILEERWDKLLGVLREAVTEIGERAIKNPSSMPRGASPDTERFRQALVDAARGLLTNPITHDLGRAFAACDVQAIEVEMERIGEMRRRDREHPFLMPAVWEEAEKLKRQALAKVKEFHATLSPEDIELAASFREPEKPPLKLLRGGEIDDKS